MVGSNENNHLQNRREDPKTEHCDCFCLGNSIAATLLIIWQIDPTIDLLTLDLGKLESP